VFSALNGQEANLKKQSQLPHRCIPGDKTKGCAPQGKFEKTDPIFDLEKLRIPEE
jgi:hypothetical protein